MDTSERGRKRREMVAPRDEPGSIPPPARPRREKNPLDPEMLWDKESDEIAEDEEYSDEAESDEWEESEESSGEDLDDWDHPIRRLKIN